MRIEKFFIGSSIMNVSINEIDRVLILDFGSQTTQLIARQIRELSVYCEVVSCTESIEKIKSFNPHALILSGGSSSVGDENAPTFPDGLLELNVPVLGICYGMQLLVNHFSGKVRGHELKEFSYAKLFQDGSSKLLQNLSMHIETWMSHGDQILELPANFKTTAQSESCPHAVIEDAQRKLYGVQFHPEVIYTKKGKEVLKNFLFSIAKLSPNWKMTDFVKQKTKEIKNQVGEDKVLLGLSGGVDSSVAAALVHKAIGQQLICVFVDHGLNRAGEVQEIERLFGEVFQMYLRIINAKDQFFAALQGVVDPEVKRKIIGKVFIDVFEREARSIGDVQFLGQGTLYPDVIESQSFHSGPSHIIKSHHNVGGLPKDIEFELVEPLRELFKDEVRKAGAALGLPSSLLMRQPFPGPGLAIRIIGEVTPAKCTLLREADAIVREEIEKAIAQDKLGKNIWQWFAVLLPVTSIGVMGDARTYDETIVVRCVESVDGMTADWVEIPKIVLGNISNRIMNEIKGVSRVVYDISSKPPSTIEWE